MIDIVYCQVGQRPEVRNLLDPMDDLNEMIKSFSMLPYPAYLRKGKQKSLKLIVDDNALLDGSPHNRWGIHGNFAVVSWAANHNFPQSLSTETVRRIIADLDNEYGLMDPRAEAEVIYAHQIGAFLKSAERFEREGGEWSPDLHWTGTHRQPEIKFINWLLLRYAPHIEAMHVGSLFGGDYSVEVQFGKSPADRMMREECRAVYCEAFDDEGVLLREIISRPPRSWS
jgi:hypothetical protein